MSGKISGPITATLVYSFTDEDGQYRRIQYTKPTDQDGLSKIISLMDEVEFDDGDEEEDDPA